jgi:hypothetical protein
MAVISREGRSSIDHHLSGHPSHHISTHLPKFRPVVVFRHNQSPILDPLKSASSHHQVDTSVNQKWRGLSFSLIVLSPPIHLGTIAMPFSLGY